MSTLIAPTRTIAGGSVQPSQGVVQLMVDGSPVTGIGWTSLCPQRRTQAEINTMDGVSTFKMARLLFVLGDSTYNICATHPPNDLTGGFQPTWDGRNGFDFTPLDREAGRILQANPKTKIILQVALDGSRQWLADHPGNQSDAGLAAKGVPDYLSPEWRQAARMALQALVDHVTHAAGGDVVVGYELFNGTSFDGNFPLSASPATVQAFRDFLRTKYQSNVASLRQAWGNDTVDFATAMPVTELDWPRVRGLLPFFAPARYREHADTREFAVVAAEQVFYDFADTVKTATNHQALVGVRGGEYLLASYDSTQPLPRQWHTMDFYTHPTIDFYEVWEHYDVARHFGPTGGSGAPLMPVQGLASFGKHYVVQNDFRVAGGTDTNPGFGYEPDINASAQKLRRVFANSLINGQSSTLFELSFSFGRPELMSEWQSHEIIAQKATRVDQHSAAEVAYVTDPQMNQYFAQSFTSADLPAGNQWVDTPGQAFYLVEPPTNMWARAGVPYDTIFLNQIETARPYKVYVFYHTIGLSADQMSRIQAMLQARHAFGIFVYADGMIDGQGNVDTTQIGRNVSQLTGMTITGSMSGRNAGMTATAAYQSLGGQIGNPVYWTYPTDKRWSPVFPVIMSLFPSFTPQPDASRGEVVLATYSEYPGQAAIVGKPFAGGGGVIYSASPYLPPGLIRLAVARAGAFQYTDTEDALFLNASLIGLYAQQTGTIHLNLPTATALYDITRNVEYPAATSFAIAAETDHTYVFYRGSATAWRSL